MLPSQNILIGIHSNTTVDPLFNSWQGLGINNNWSVGNNWNTGVAPIAYNSLHFGSSPRLNPYNDLTVNTPFKVVNFSYRASSYVLSGNSFTLYAEGIINNSYNTQTITNNISLSGTAGIVFNTSNSGIAVIGSMSGTNALIKTGGDILTLSGTNTYTGGTYISAGTVKLGNIYALGADDGICNIAAGATMDLNDFQQMRRISFTGAGVITNTLNGFQRTLTCGHGTVNAIFTGAINQPPSTGSIAITKVDANTQTFNGTNTSTGQVRINGGTLELSQLNDGVARDIIFGSTTGIPIFKYIGSSDTNLPRRKIIIDSPSLSAILNSSGTGILSTGGAETGSLTTGARFLILQGSNSGNNTIGHSTSPIINGVNTLSIVKDGIGKWVLGSQNNTYTGYTSILGGTLVAVKGIATASFTPTALSVTFSTPPFPGTTYRFFPGPTIQTYASVALIGAIGRTGSYNSSNSTLTIS